MRMRSCIFFGAFLNLISDPTRFAQPETQCYSHEIMF